MSLERRSAGTTPARRANRNDGAGKSPETRLTGTVHAFSESMGGAENPHGTGLGTHDRRARRQGHRRRLCRRKNRAARMPATQVPRCNLKPVDQSLFQKRAPARETRQRTISNTTFSGSVRPRRYTIGTTAAAARRRDGAPGLTPGIDGSHPSAGEDRGTARRGKTSRAHATNHGLR